MQIQAVIMAGGKGTRLRAITNDEIPKPMAPIAGKPILEWQIECLRRQGIQEIILIIGHLGHKIREYFGDGTAFGVKISYIEETEPLGTAGALSMLPEKLTGSAFFLIFGDVLFDIDLDRMRRFHEEKKAVATLFVHPNVHPFDSDLVVCDAAGRVKQFDSKHNVRDYWYQNCVNAGFYLMDRSVCNRVPQGQKTDLEKDILNAMIADGDAIYGYRSPEYIKDVGTVERIRRAEQELTSGFIAGRNLNKPQRAIFLDRDGTINRKNGLVYQEEQFELEPCAVEAIRAINSSGYLAIVVTNQPVVARGLCQIDDVERIHRKMETLLGQEGVYLDDICYCPHHPDKGYPEENPAYKIPCHCRKPDIGMLQDCVRKYHIDLAESWVIGDTTVDIQTGKNAGTKTALVLTGDAGKDGKYNVQPDLVAKDLLQAIKEITK
mgnify:FL=1